MTSGGDGRNAVERYRAVVAGLADAVGELRERDAVRAEELRRELRERERALRTAADTVTLGRGMFELRWEAALRVLWSYEEPGRPRPRPDPRADPERVDELEHDADRALAELRDAGSRRLLPRRRTGD
ncbi:hypothetical protein ACLFMI_14075 [Pseudonocardia nantongensis]|uniref:hypothetical protein n=1 Tax=Pseudonocardia nantongensis TaxID=1181885 RepID=UPI003978B2DD